MRVKSARNLAFAHAGKVGVAQGHNDSLAPDTSPVFQELAEAKVLTDYSPDSLSSSSIQYRNCLSLTPSQKYYAFLFFNSLYVS